MKRSSPNANVTVTTAANVCTYTTPYATSALVRQRCQQSSALVPLPESINSSSLSSSQDSTSTQKHTILHQRSWISTNRTTLPQLTAAGDAALGACEP